MKTTTIKFEVNIPLMNENNPKCYMGDCDALAYDIIGTYAEVLIQTLKNRLGACCFEVVRAYYDGRVYFNDGSRIEYTRNTKIAHSYNEASKRVLEDAIKALEHSEWKSFLHNASMLEQTIKAVMNDPNLKTVDCGSFSWADLTSTLVICYTSAIYNNM